MKWCSEDAIKKSHIVQHVNSIRVFSLGWIEVCILNLLGLVP